MGLVLLGVYYATIMCATLKAGSMTHDQLKLQFAPCQNNWKMLHSETMHTRLENVGKESSCLGHMEIMTRGENCTTCVVLLNKYIIQALGHERSGSFSSQFLTQMGQFMINVVISNQFNFRAKA